MVALLAFIGLIFILWFITKGLKKASVWLTNTSIEMIDYASTMSKMKVEEDKELRQQNRKVAETLQSIKEGEKISDPFMEAVRKEISMLEKESNKH
jgi:hypothetical protein